MNSLSTSFKLIMVFLLSICFGVGMSCIQKTYASEIPEILTHPESIRALYGEEVTFTISASGTNLKYTWQYKPNINNGVWTNAGNTTNTLKVKATTNNQYLYRCLVSDDVYSGDSAIKSDAACLYIINSQVYKVKYITQTPTAPKITKQPLPAQAPMGEKVTFTVEVEGDNLEYQWQYKSSIENATWTNATKNEGTGYNTNTFTTIALMDSQSGYEYRCIIRDSDGYYYGDQNAVISDTVTVEVTKDGYSRVVYINESYDITQNPLTVLTYSGESATFKVSATGNTTLTYRWLYKTTDENSVWSEVPESFASGTKTDTLVINKVLDDYSGYMFRCSVGGSMYVYEKSLLSNTAYLLTIEPAQTIKARVDMITYYYEDGNEYDSNWTSQNVVVKIPITDEKMTGVAIKIGSGDWEEEPSYASMDKSSSTEIVLTLNESISGELYINRIDADGNVIKEDTEGKVIKIDKELPRIDQITYKTKDGELELTAKVSDTNSGIEYYAINVKEKTPTMWNVYDESVKDIIAVLPTSGTYYLYLKDRAENISSQSIAAVKDVKPPVGSIEIVAKNISSGEKYTNEDTVTININVTDNESPMAEIMFAIYNEEDYEKIKNGEKEIEWRQYAPSIDFPLKEADGLNVIYAIFKDGAGNTTLKNIKNN